MVVLLVVGTPPVGIACYAPVGVEGEREQTYIVQEHLTGGQELSQILSSEGSLEAGRAVRLAVQVCKALSAIHGAGFVHRDIKPSNVFVERSDSGSERVILLDFGIARPMEVTKRLTAAGALIGTPQYMAPEQLVEGGRIRPATDVLSAGCIFYECLTGKPAFDATHVVGVIARILHDDPTPLRLIRPDVPPAWDDLLSRMLKYFD